MSQVRMIVRDAHRSLYADVHGSHADLALAALSDDPETIEGLSTAIHRFPRVPQKDLFGLFRSGEDDTEYDAGLVIFDLAARLIVWKSTYSAATAEGEIGFSDDKGARQWFSYHLSDDWRIIDDPSCWQSIARERREERQTNPPQDFRPVLWGEPLLRFIAEECFAAFTGRPKADRDNYHDQAGREEHDMVRQIHARWLMNAHEDLGGQSPRQVLFARRKRVDQCVHDRRTQWDATLSPPAPLPSDTAAYRFSGIGTHEAVIYYEYVRDLLWECRDMLADLAGRQEATSRDGFVEGVVPVLRRSADVWLNTPNPEFSFHTPQKVIHNERSRMPEVLAPGEGIVDDDCPLCHLAEELGPGFWHLDGCNMDNDFAFSLYHETLEEWQEEQRKWEEHDRKWEAEQEERKRLGVDYEASKGAVVYHGGSGVSLFSIGADLCGIIVDLKEQPDGRRAIDELNQAFANLREVVLRMATESAAALLEPVAEAMSRVLDDVAARHPAVANPCERLQADLKRLARPDEPLEDDTGDVDHGDMPF